MENNTPAQNNQQQNSYTSQTNCQNNSYAAPPAGAPQYNMPPQKIKKPVYKKWWFWLIIAAAVLIVIIACSGGDSGSDTAGEVQTVTDTHSQTDSANSANTQTPIEAGTTVTIDNLEISYISCNTDYTAYNEYSAPASGNKVIRAEFEFKNISDSDCSLSGFQCYADGAKCNEFYSADDYASPTLETISPNRTLKSVVYFEVPENAENIEMEMETNYWTDDKIIFSVK